MTTPRHQVYAARGLGAALDNGAGTPRVRAAGRTCAAEGCETRLSIYNPGRLCAVHGRAAKTGRAVPRRAPARTFPPGWIAL